MVLSLVLLAACAPRRAPQPKKPDFYPARVPVPLLTLDGKPAALAPLLGARLTVVNLWATWCAPCARELPEIASLWRKLKARGTQGVHFVAISLDDSLPGVKVFAQRLGLPFPVLFGGQPYARALGVEGIPVTLFLNDKGKVIDGILAETDAATLEARIRHLLGEKLDDLVP